MNVHPTAIVDPGAFIAPEAQIGPYCIIGPGVRIGEGCRLIARVTVSGPALIGRGNVFHPNVIIASPPQDRRAPPPDGKVEIGDENLFREAVAVNLPVTPGGVTRIGSRNLFNTLSHVGHDCVVGDGSQIGRLVGLAGSSHVEDGVQMQDASATREGIRLGRRCCVATHSLADDVPPYLWGEGSDFEIKGVNPAFRTEALERAFEIIWKSGLPRGAALERLDPEASPEVAELVGFLRARPIPRPGGAGDE
jgi:UDP-N-acetylglucosamine acyltransferase